MKARQLFVVEYTYTLVVLAETAEEAEREGVAVAGDDDGLPEVHVHPMTRMPGDWDANSIPYGYADPSDMDRTLGQWIELGAAPLFKRPEDL